MIKGSKHLEETKKKISNALKGRKIGFALRPTEEGKKKIREANKGKKHSEITKEKMRLGHLGKTYKMSERGKKNISKARIGKKLSEKTKKKISEMAKRIGTGKWMKGRKLSIEIRRKISESLKGEKCYYWKGGVSLENHKIRTGIEFRLWREAVFARDNWTCQKCGDNKGHYLHPHHIQNFAQYPELRFAINNGITLCRKCHRKFHKKYGTRNNTREQLEEFLKVEDKNNK